MRETFIASSIRASLISAALVTGVALSGLSISRSEVIKAEQAPAAPSDSPWSAVGKLYSGSAVGCTAIAIETDQLLTAAHCVFTRRTGVFLQPSSLHFLLGLERGDYGTHTLIDSYTTGPKYDPSRPFETASSDWAVLHLKQPLPSEYRPVPLATDMPENGASILIGGYRQDRAFAMSVDENCRILQIIRGLLIHNCHAGHGYSGAPLIQLPNATKPMQVVGIHVGRGYFQGVKVSIAIPAAMIGR
jgi:protease YdgD